MVFPQRRRLIQARAWHGRRCILNCATSLICIGLLSGCISDPKPPLATQSPSLREAVGTIDFIASDGTVLPATRWTAAEPSAILIALHGMNDYARAFEGAGMFWADHAITVYAFDQRTFGRGRQVANKLGKGKSEAQWPGRAALNADLRDVIASVRARHSQLPVYVLGHSMGGAVVISANSEMPLDADGIILAAPAIWGGNRMPLFYRISLTIAASVAPSKTLTGARAQRQATDNIPILRAMNADPYIIKQTPLRAISGLVRLMGKANAGVKDLHGNILFLVGCKDEMVPVRDLLEVADMAAFSHQPNVDIRTYRDGWHLLFRDLQAPMVWADVAEWIDQQQSVPEGDDAARQATKARGAASSSSGRCQ